MTAVVCDASVVVKWIHRRGEEEVEQARSVLSAHTAGRLAVRLLDLTFYEIGNFLVRRPGAKTSDPAAQLADLELVAGEPLRPGRAEIADAARLAATHGLTFYDALYWAAARSLGAALVTADRELIAAGAGESPTEFCERLGLR